MILQLLDDFEEKLASFTPSVLFLFKTSCFFFGENSTSPSLSTSTRPIEIEKPQSTKHGVALIDILCMFAMILVLYVGETDFVVADHDR